MEKTKQNVIVICGQTASGKTALALQLAKELPKANILNVDSRQAYQGLDILTGKDIPKTLSDNISIFGLDLFRPDETANLGIFTRYAKRVIRDSVETNTPLIIVGGTGLYLKAITEDLSNISIAPNPTLRLKLEKFSVLELQNILKKKDFSKFSSLNHSDVMNPRRLIRALEILEAKKPEQLTDNLSLNFHWIGLMSNKKFLSEKIKIRVTQRIKDGVINEVISLADNFKDHTLPIFSSLGVSQILSFLAKECTREELINNWAKEEIAYTRRQAVWFKKQPHIIWYDKDINKEKLIEELLNFYKKNA